MRCVVTQVTVMSEVVLNRYSNGEEVIVGIEKSGSFEPYFLISNGFRSFNLDFFGGFGG